MGESLDMTGFMSSAHEKDIFAVSLVGSEPLQALLGSMTSLLHLGFHFHAADEHHLDLLLGFYDDALQDLADHCIVIGKRMIFHAVEDGEDIVQSGRRILPVLLGGSVFCQFLFKLALFCHQIRNAGISEQLLLIFGSHAVQQAFEFLIDLRNADLYFNALVLSGPGTEAQPNVLLEGLQDIRVDLRCFQNCIHDGVLQWCFFHRRRVMAVFFAVVQPVDAAPDDSLFPAYGPCAATVKQLMKQNAGVSSIEITDSNIKAFESTAKKYGVDFALKKDATESPPRYLVFFKGRDADVLTAAFQEFSAKKLTQEQKPSIRKALSAFKEAAKQLNADRQKVKNQTRGGIER